jgi:AraC-like DNA-binding protein
MPRPKAQELIRLLETEPDLSIADLQHRVGCSRAYAQRLWREHHEARSA